MASEPVGQGASPLGTPGRAAGGFFKSAGPRPATLGAVEACDLLFFEAGGQVFATSPIEVVRIDRPVRSLATATLRDSSAGRVLVVLGERDEGSSGEPPARFEFQIPVDRVLGVRRFPRTALRRPPVLAQSIGGPRAAEVMGLVLDGQTPVLIVDVRELGARVCAPLEDPESSPAPTPGVDRI